jgi:hypothetical protein
MSSSHGLDQLQAFILVICAHPATSDVDLLHAGWQAAASGITTQTSMPLRASKTWVQPEVPSLWPNSMCHSMLHGGISGSLLACCRLEHWHCQMHCHIQPFHCLHCSCHLPHSVELLTYCRAAHVHAVDSLPLQESVFCTAAVFAAYVY